MTNLERIKNMSVEELVGLIVELGNYDEYSCICCYYRDEETCPDDCRDGIRRWFLSEDKE